MLEVDLARYLAPPLSLDRAADPPEAQADAPGARPRPRAAPWPPRTARRSTSPRPRDDRVCAYFHTGGTTGLPKVAQHRASGILYNGWCGKYYIFTEADVLMCPLPLFHVFAAYPILMSCLMTGAQMVMPTPQGYRGEGVMDNFWKLIARHRVTFLITVPTAVAALMQRKVDADVSTLRLAISGSAAMPVELFHRFEEATGRQGDGGLRHDRGDLPRLDQPARTASARSAASASPSPTPTCASCTATPDGAILKECATDEVGEICVRNPGVRADVYTDPPRNRGRRHRRTAICAPAISGGSTPTATSGSPAAPRT